MLDEGLKEKSGSRLFELLLACIYIVGKAQRFESNHFYTEFMTEKSENITIVILFYYYLFSFL